MQVGIADVRRVIAEPRERLGRQRPADDPVPGRDPPLQQGAAGRAAAGGRVGADHADRRDHREPVLRGQLGAALAVRAVRAGAAVAATTWRGIVRARRGATLGVTLDGDVRDADRRARPGGDGRNALNILERGGGGGRAAAASRREHVARGRPQAAAALRQGRRPPLRRHVGLHQEHARLGCGRRDLLPGRDDRGRRGSRSSSPGG